MLFSTSHSVTRNLAVHCGVRETFLAWEETLHFYLVASVEYLAYCMAVCRQRSYSGTQALNLCHTETCKLGIYCYVQRRSPEDATIRELAPEFRPPEWLTDVVARTTPYFPQMGDEVIYFVQGHQQYVDAVKTNNVYHIDVDRNQPWHKMPHIRVCWHCLCDSENYWD